MAPAQARGASARAATPETLSNAHLHALRRCARRADGDAADGHAGDEGYGALKAQVCGGVVRKGWEPEAAGAGDRRRSVRRARRRPSALPRATHPCSTSAAEAA